MNLQKVYQFLAKESLIQPRYVVSILVATNFKFEYVGMCTEAF